MNTVVMILIYPLNEVDLRSILCESIINSLANFQNKALATLVHSQLKEKRNKKNTYNIKAIRLKEPKKSESYLQDLKVYNQITIKKQ